MSTCPCTPDEVQAWTPACMDADELATWRRRPRTSEGHDAWDIRPCRDCTLGFAAEMRAQGRCNGTPGGVEEEDEMTEQPTAQGPIRAPAALQRRVDLDVVAPPCASCLHEPVCALRQALEAIASVETTAPPLPDGLQLTLSAAISCDHYARDRARPAPARVLTSSQRGAANRVAGEQAKRQMSDETRERMRQAQIRMMAERRAAADKANPA